MRGGFALNIYVDEEFNYIKLELLDRGYNIVMDSSTPCDAVICNLKNCDFSSISGQINLKREGSLIIDCGSKSIDDIDYILNNRSYSNIL